MSCVIQVKVYRVGGEVSEGLFRFFLLYLKREKALHLPSPKISLSVEASFRKSFFLLSFLLRGAE